MKAAVLAGARRRRSTLPQAGRLLGVAGALCVAAGACDSGGGNAQSTLGPLASGATAVTAAASGNVGGSPATAPTGPTGAGFVSIQVRLTASGIDEQVALDRATVAEDALDPISLDANCTALDGGDGLDVAVTDLRRIGDGSRVVTARLHVDPPVEGQGEYQGTLEIGDAEQVVTSYVGTVTVADGAASGAFDVVDEQGNSATGTFVCSTEPVVTTTVAATGGGEEVPATSAPPGATTALPTSTSLAPVTLPPVTLPALTVPEATS